MKKTLLTRVLAMAVPLTMPLTMPLTISLTVSSVYADESAKTISMTQSLLDNVIMPDIDTAQSAVAALQKALAENADGGQRGQAVDQAFSQLVSAWKAVQTAYIVGELDSSMIDTPRLMDTFHEGNEKLSEQIQRAVNSGDEPRVALFKNTFKSINALAILLYTDKDLNAGERRYADYVLTTLGKHLSDIKTAYAAQTSAFNKNQDQSMSYILNALIDSSYKLKEWRIGEAAGLTKKYAGKANNRHQEYPRSGNSLLAAEAIIAVHDKMMGQRDYENLGSAAIKQGAEKEVTAIRQLIGKAQQQLAALQADKVNDFADSRIKPLYETLGQLNDAYYQSLVKALPVQAKILDADGD